MSSTISSLELVEISSWEKAAKTWWGRYISKIEEQAILRASDFAKGNSINNALENGCERGRWAKLLAYRGWTIIFTDINIRKIWKFAIEKSRVQVFVECPM